MWPLARGSSLAWHPAQWRLRTQQCLQIFPHPVDKVLSFWQMRWPDCAIAQTL